jgi:type VI secretion system protein VasJ
MADMETTPQQSALSPLLEGVQRPIPGDNPCGRDISYDEDFLAIKAEIDKMSTVGGQVDQARAAELRQLMDTTRGTVRQEDRVEKQKELDQRASVVKQSGGPDYELIRRIASVILAQKSKDLRVASYLCYALWRLDSFTGLAEGLTALEIHLRQYWEGLYPGKNRLSARKGALEFLIARLDESIGIAQVREVDRVPLERAKGAIRNLQEQVQEKMPENPPSLLGIAQVVEKYLNKLSRPASSAKPEAASKPVATASPAAEPGHVTREEPKAASSPQSEIHSLQGATTLVRQAARYIRQLNAHDATPYRLLRSVSWDLIDILPPNDNGKTGFQAPPAGDRQYLAGLRDKKEWAKLLDECEENLHQMGFHVWLDMQRYLVEALDGLGSDFAGVRAAVIAELLLLLHRVPRLPSLAFADGTRFADPATVAWIDEVQASSSNASAPQIPGPAMSTGELETQLEEAKKVFAAGDLAGAIALLVSPQADMSRKALFRRKLAMATYCMRGGQPAIARPLLEELEQEIEHFSIHEWEPRLALEAWTTLNKCYETLATVPDTSAAETLRRRGENLFERICKLDVGFALASAGVRPAGKGRPNSTQQVRQPTNGNGDGTVETKESTTQSPS